MCDFVYGCNSVVCQSTFLVALIIILKGRYDIQHFEKVLGHHYICCFGSTNMTIYIYIYMFLSLCIRIQLENIKYMYTVLKTQHKNITKLLYLKPKIIKYYTLTRDLFALFLCAFLKQEYKQRFID